MRTKTLGLSLLLAACTLVPSTARAQFVPRPMADAPLAERYIIEAQGGFWNPGPTMSITSESLGIIGSTIDFKTDLGLKQTRFKQFRATLHPARKHKFRFEYIPIDYKQNTVLRRDIVFNGQRYNVGVPVISELDWKAYRFSYEYDFISMAKGFGGFVLDLKQTGNDNKHFIAILALHNYRRSRLDVVAPAIGKKLADVVRRQSAEQFHRLGKLFD